MKKKPQFYVILNNKTPFYVKFKHFGGPVFVVVGSIFYA